METKSYKFITQIEEDLTEYDWKQKYSILLGTLMSFTKAFSQEDKILQCFSDFKELFDKEKFKM